MDNEGLNNEDLTVVGKVVKEWGIKGDMLVLPLTFDPEQFSKLNEIVIQPEAAARSGSNMQIVWKMLQSVRPHKNLLLVKIDGCETPEEARKYRNALIKIKKSQRPDLPDGVYYHHQIVGLAVYTDDGICLGEIKEIIETRSNDVYVVRGEGREYLIPAVNDAVKEIDLKSKKMVIKLMEVVEP